MNSKTKTHQNRNIAYSTIFTAVGAWLMAVATLIGMTEINREPVALVNSGASHYMTVNDVSNLWTRKDSENETVHMPTKFDIGLRIPGITGRQ